MSLLRHPRRPAPVSLATLAVVTGPTAAAPASTAAAAPTCRGERASAVGSPGEPLRGTAGRDVVVTAGADLVRYEPSSDCPAGLPVTGVRADGDLDDDLAGADECRAERRNGCES